MRRIALTLVAAIALSLPATVAAGRPPPSLKAWHGVRLGDTRAHVRSVWGTKFVVCKAASCRGTTWLYFAQTGMPTGIAVRFDAAGRVEAIYRIGAGA